MPRAHDGQWLANGYTTQSLGSIYQEVPVSGLSPGQSFVGSMWVRSSDGTPVVGELALFEENGPDSNVTYFTAGKQWTQIQVPLDINASTITAIRLQLYLATVGHNLDFDGAQLSTNLLFNASFEGHMAGWTTIDGFAAAAYNDVPRAHDGQWLANGYTTQSLGSIYQEVPVSGLSPGQSFVGSMWVRSSDGTPVVGELALFEENGPDSNVTYFTAGKQWTQIQVPLDINASTITAIRLQLYLATVGHNLDFDGAQLSTNLLFNASFEGHMAGWTTIDGFAAAAYNDVPRAHDGQWLANGYTTQSLGSIYQEVPVSGLSPGQSFVGSMWVRSSDGTPVVGELALFEENGPDSNVTYFTAGKQWTQIQVPLDINASTITAIRLQLYLATVGHNLDFDGAQLTGRP